MRLDLPEHGTSPTPPRFPTEFLGRRTFLRVLQAHRLVVASLLLAAQWSASLPAQTDWRTGHPNGRSDHAMAYDAARQRVVLFGGLDQNSFPLFNRYNRLGDTWEFTTARLGTYATFGAACIGSAGLPGLRPDLLPEVGQLFRIHLWGLPANQPGVVLLGSSRTSWTGVPLPLDLTPIGMPGCTLLVSGQIIDALPPSPQGNLTWGFPIPRDPVLLGGGFYNQAFFLDPQVNPAGLIATNAGHGTVGG